MERKEFLKKLGYSAAAFFIVDLFISIIVPKLAKKCVAWYSGSMQKIATRFFIGASIAFGIIGIILVLAGGLDGEQTVLSEILVRLLQATVFIILPSFAISIAGKYLSQKS